MSIEELNNLPIKTVNGATIYIHDIGNVRDGFPPQTNIVRVDGQRASLMTILKTGNASTLDIISSVHKSCIAADRRRSCRRNLQIKFHLPTSRSSSAAPSTAWCARPSSPPASPPS